MRLTLTARETAEILRKRDAKGRQKLRGSRVIQQRVADKGRDRDPDYLAWLHHGMPCIGCLILGPAPAEHAHIEAAHQKAQDAARGWHKLMGRRVHDRQACPLCAYHHRLGPTCCDPAQAKFWSVLGVDVIDLCSDLYRAFQNGDAGRFVVWDHAQRAMGCGSAA